MAIAIKMPRLSDTMLEGNIKTWNKKVGDLVKPGDILAEVETDKATMDLEAYQEGVLLYIAVPSGPIAVDGLIAIIGNAGEDFSNLLSSSDQTSPKQDTGETKIKEEKNERVEPTKVSSESPDNLQTKTSPEQVKDDKIKDETKESSKSLKENSTPADDSRIKASPLAKHIAKEKGISLESVSGSGEQGRIVKRDLENISSKPASKASTMDIKALGDREVPLSQIRKTIARRLSESKFSAPHFYLITEVDMDRCVEARAQLNSATDTKISFNDLIVKACASAIRKNLAVNVSWMGDKMIYHNDIHIGVAVAIDEGLVVPVITHADLKSLSVLKDEINDKASRAKERKLNLDEMQGNTFTISNLGMFDIEHFTAIINPPDACILAVGSISKQPAVKNDAVVISNRMKLTLSCDHRAVDGATGAKFLQTLKFILENPITMLL